MQIVPKFLPMNGETKSLSKQDLLSCVQETKLSATTVNPCVTEFIRKRYGQTLAQFEQHFHPTKQTNMLNHLAVCLFGDPRWNVCTPRNIDSTYGTYATRDWLANQFAFHFNAVAVAVSYQFCQELAVSSLALYTFTAPAYMAFLAMARFGQLGDTYGRHDAETYGRLLSNFQRFKTDNARWLDKEAKDKTQQLFNAGKLHFVELQPTTQQLPPAIR